ncbi:MAG: hypothetical protein Q7P63_13690 [Verrucomicrobiota bacterium JB022]|nr:hypothetical protein [Verrucomicrobiota bacterium JB022]
MSQPESSSLVDRLDALYEYDREPIKENKLHGHKTFIAMFAGEHVAGTELVLGPLMLAHGVTAKDFFLGLIVGNLLAVLSWALICAPIAVKTRLTIYWQLKKIAGPYLMVIYSALYAVVLCLLAGAMVQVSTSAVSLLFPAIHNPESSAWLASPSWITLAVFVGAVIAVLAVLGFEKLAHFSKICAPWMALVFAACGIAVLPQLGVTGLGDLWTVFDEKIFTGVPFEGFSKYTFWHVAGFAWLCNAAQHLGMSDITIFRYAKKWTSGFASAFGMYIGHFMAWISSALLCAAYVKINEGATSFPPGEIGFLGAGLAGAILVVIAGWTTANPTLYRAGLAIQVATPNWQRWQVTFLAGGVMIVLACIPALLKSLDLVVASYGLFFLPFGACVLMDYWVLPKIGLKRNFAELANIGFSWPTFVAWIGSFLPLWLLWAKDNVAFLKWINDIVPGFIADLHVELMFLALPAWIAAMILYVVCSTIQQKNAPAHLTQTAQA